MSLLLLPLVTGPVLAQQSTSFEVEEHVFNAGGHPEAGIVMSSVSFKVSLDALGESVLGTGLSSTSFQIDGGFSSAYPPPGEVTGLEFADKQTLEWDGAHSPGDYNLYRSGSASAVDPCLQSEIPVETATDTDDPASAAVFFYLVTTENRLGEEAITGFRSDGTERGNPTPCP